MRSYLVAFILLLLSLNLFAQKSFDPTLKRQLDSVMAMDQKYRNIIQFGSATVKDSIAVKWRLENVKSVDDSLWAIQKSLDSTNLLFVERTIKKRGYPGKSIVGEPASETAWYVIQHSRKIKQYFSTIQKAGRDGELEQYLVAKMEDRLLTEENKPQIYGTQAIGLPVMDSISHKLVNRNYIWPIKDDLHVNELRKKAGFKETIEENARRLNAIYDRLTMEKLKEMSRVVVYEGDSANIKEKVKLLDRVTLPREELKGSSFYCLKQLDSLSNSKDSVAAGSCLLKIDPYYLMYQGQTPTKLRAFLTRYKITKGACAQYETIFAAVYETNQSKEYDTLRRMQQRTALLLRALDSVPAKMKGAVEAEIHIADSVHFRFLRRYINETGWPDLAHGSLYAAYIAARDVEHVADYVPKAYLAFQNGQLGMAAVNRLYQNRYFLSDVLTVMPLLQGHGLKFDVSSFLEGDVPSNLQEVLSAVHQHCPIKDVVCVLECNWSQSARQAYASLMEMKHGQDSWLRLVGGVGDACPNWQLRGLEHKIMVYRMPSDRKVNRLTAYVLFE